MKKNKKKRMLIYGLLFITLVSSCNQENSEQPTFLRENERLIVVKIPGDGSHCMDTRMKYKNTAEHFLETTNLGRLLGIGALISSDNEVEYYELRIATHSRGEIKRKFRKELNEINAPSGIVFE